LNAAKPLMKQLSEQHDIPVENLVTPESLRRVLWQPPPVPDRASVEAALAEVGARAWQQQIVAPVVIEALQSSAGDDTPGMGNISHVI